ncbi:MAG: hypothetical protein ACTSYQ_00345, partial [Candidatus Odinarchaeia archaeon]
ELMKKIIPYAIRREKKLNKNLTINVCTNFTLLNEEHLLFLRKYNVKLIISMVGKKEYHNRLRKFYNSKGTYDSIVRKLPLLFRIIPLENIGVSFCIFPSTVEFMRENFHHLINLGFNHINFEIIREYEEWREEKIEKFVFEFSKIMKDIFLSILKKRFIFLNPINWEIKYGLLSKHLRGMCPFNYKLEVYPKGEMAFSPFLLNFSDKDRYIIGNVNAQELRKFNSCRFNPDHKICQRCENEYFKNYPGDRKASDVYRLYHLFCLRAAKNIQNSTYRNGAFKNYIQKIEKEVCF